VQANPGLCAPAIAGLARCMEHRRDVSHGNMNSASRQAAIPIFMRLALTQLLATVPITMKVASSYRAGNGMRCRYSCDLHESRTLGGRG
jgi:hypothetical protein